MTIEAPEQVMLETVQGWLGSISVENGYFTDVAGRVFFDRPANRDTPLPLIILDDDSGEFSGNSNKTMVSVEFYIVGVLALPIDGDQKRPGRRFLWDMRQCLRGHLKHDPIVGFDVSFLRQSVEEPEDQSAILLPTLHCTASFPDKEIKARY
jgi:hypothetical protein